MRYKNWIQLIIHWEILKKRQINTPQKQEANKLSTEEDEDIGVQPVVDNEEFSGFKPFITEPASM